MTSSTSSTSAVALSDVESALIRAIYGQGRRWRPNCSSCVVVAIPESTTCDPAIHAEPAIHVEMDIPATAIHVEPIRERHETYVGLRAFVSAAGGRGWPWAAARIASWREDAVLVRAAPGAPLRVLRVANGAVIGEDAPGSAGYASVVRVLLGPGAA